jgi:hypothetical protein
MREGSALRVAELFSTITQGGNSHTERAMRSCRLGRSRAGAGTLREQRLHRDGVVGHQAREEPVETPFVGRRIQPDDETKLTRAAKSSESVSEPLSAF